MFKDNIAVCYTYILVLQQLFINDDELVVNNVGPIACSVPLKMSVRIVVIVNQCTRTTLAVQIVAPVLSNTKTVKLKRTTDAVQRL